MSTANFCYQNRCVLITNEDFENGNYPEYSKSNNQNRNYPAYNIDDERNELDYFDIVISFGYYRDACLDFIEKDNPDNLEKYIGYIDDFENKTEFYNAILDNKDYLHISKYMLYKLCSKHSINECYDILDEYLMDKEYKIANKIIDNIKKEYGYKELNCIANLSNGEAIYEYAK